ncbi:hypothetical protein BDU57DRAFT_518216 [Ampelomyces quisqualis]|uniref:Cell wall protein PhiA n=1 Tax=Ampelomyces quisqualis TaxID=50730 RepID=A0A6A5QIP2_AMPQU|nr:hypothetical protein BDU57DRAFT_518216 [Ampelomyces quisqualis]
MKFTTSAIIATSVALASATPIDGGAVPKFDGNGVFRVMAIRSGSDIQYANIQAATGGLRINYPKQNSSCSEPDINYASFTLSQDTGDLYLYTANPPLQAYVDRSGMGQGVLQFSTGAQPIGRNQERGPFKIDEDGNLVFAAANGVVGFQACPNALGGGYSVWLAGATNPGGNSNCVGFVAKALKEDPRVKCHYSGMST